MQHPEHVPTLAARLARDPRLGVRVAHFYERLRALPRGQRRLFGRRARMTLAAAALLLALSRAPALPARADTSATITVASMINVAAGEVAVADNDLCSLIEAINNANDTADGVGNPPGHDDCAAGDPTGADTIAIASGGTFNISESLNYDYGYTGLPLITSTITVEGNGAIITRTGNDDLRFFTVITGGDLTLDSLELTNGKNIYYNGGAVYVYDAKLTIANSTISGNEAGTGGGLSSYQGEIVITDSTFTGNSSYLAGAIYAGYGTLTITDSVLSGNQAIDSTGGGLYVLAGTATITNVTADGNSSDSGAGIMINYAEATIADSTITGNQASEFGGGGGLYFIEATASVTNTVVTTNEALNGAGVMIIGGEVDMTGGLISGNAASGSGGGVYTGDATAAFEGTTIRDNTAGYWGGGFYVDGAALTVTGATINGNTAAANGGGLAATGATTGLTLSDSSVSGNTATEDGGGLFQEQGAAAVTNSTLSGNQAGVGGGIHSAGAMTLINVTVSDNTAATSGGGTFTLDGTLTLERSLVAGNTAPTGREAHRAGGTVAADAYDLFGFDGDAGLSGFTAGATDVVPGVAITAVLGPLGDNGGPTQTQALAAGSPAIDAAPSADCAAPPVNGLDQRGEPRNRDNDGAGSPNECDIGAFEAPGGDPPPPSFLISVPVILR